MKTDVIIVGAGDMAIEYSKVLDGLKKEYVVIGRGEEKANRFEFITGHKVYRGGVEYYFDEGAPIPTHAIVVVYPLSLYSVAEYLINIGVKDLLLEKPGGMNYNELKKLSDMSKAKKASVFIAYNRRFYASVEKAKELIAKDGGVTSFNFEFTEWSHKIEKLSKPKDELEGWLMANSTHVIDLAFYLGGKPKEMSSYVVGSLPWYSKAYAFAGSGVTNNGVLFTYKANWKSAGRWSIEILTNEHKFIFEPIESLKIQNRGEINICQVEIDDEIDKKYKAGLYKEVEAFINGNTINLPDIHEQKDNAIIYESMETNGLKMF